MRKARFSVNWELVIKFDGGREVRIPLDDARRESAEEAGIILSGLIKAGEVWVCNDRQGDVARYREKEPHLINCW